MGVLVEDCECNSAKETGFITGVIDGYGITADSKGKMMAVSLTTGKVEEVETVLQVKGTVNITPDQQEAEFEAKIRRMKYLIEKERRQLRQNQNLPFGKFFFVLADERFADVQPETIAKLIYLSTYMTYGNKLMLSERTAMRYADLQEVLGVSNTTVWRFWKTVSPEYIIEDKDGFLHMNKDIFRCGSLGRREYTRWQQCYVKGIRALYKGLNMRNHKHMGYLFQLLQYVNIEHNILCWNPWEVNADKIEAMTLEEFCVQIGYDYNHADALLTLYRNIRFDIDGRQETILAIVYDGVHRKNAKMIINPRIVYNGSNYSNVTNYEIFYR